MAGFGGGAFIFDQIQTAFLNPENVKAVGQDMLNTTQDVGKEKYVKMSARRQSPVLYKCTSIPLSFTYVHLWSGTVAYMQGCLLPYGGRALVISETSEMDNISVSEYNSSFSTFCSILSSIANHPIVSCDKLNQARS